MLSTFVFKKCSEKIHSHLNIVIKSFKGFGWPSGGPALHQHWVNVSCYLVFLALEWKASPA